MAKVTKTIRKKDKKDQRGRSSSGKLPPVACGRDHKHLHNWEQAMCRRVDKNFIPGFCACVVHQGSIVHLSEYGYSDIERKEPFTKDSIVRIYCMTKTLVAVGILILKERGLLSLIDPVSKYIPAFKRLKVVKHGNAMFDVGEESPSFTKEFTIIRLLTHTAGLGYGADFGEEPTGGECGMYKSLLAAVDNRTITTLEDFCNNLAKLPLRHQPGKDLHYSMGHDILARIIEVVSSSSLDSFFEKELFNPLGMCDTSFFVPRDKATRLAALYGSAERSERVARNLGRTCNVARRRACAFLHRIDGDSPSESNWLEGQHCQVFSGNGILGTNMGGLVSTISDQVRFFTMLLNGGALGSHRILQTATVHEFCFQDLLPLPSVRGRRRRTGQPWSGWSALGEVGMKRLKRDPIPKSDEYEEGEIAMGGAANTMWSINPARDVVTLIFTQALDSEMWRPDTETKGGKLVPSPENFPAAVRACMPKETASAFHRRINYNEGRVTTEDTSQR